MKDQYFTVYIKADPDDERSPREVARDVQAAIKEVTGVAPPVKFDVLMTIIWLNEQEKKDGIEYKGAGYGQRHHLELIKRAYGDRV